jgi:ABC-type Fe3+ transport system substrate-binding protein
MREVIWPSFLNDDGVVAELDYRQDVDMARLESDVDRSELGSRPDVLVVANPLVFARAGLIESIDAVASGDVPAAWTDPDRRWWPLYIQPIVFVYNAHYRLPPAGWEALADPGWDARLVFEAPARMLTTGPALAELHSAFGATAWSRWLAAIADRRPRQVADNERAVLEVATGSRWGGLSNWNVARRVRPGSPVRHVFLDPTPCIPGFAVVVDGGAWPELARRFVRWLVSDGGQRAYASTGRIPASASDTDVLGLSKVVPPGVRPLLGTADWIADPDPWIEMFEAAFPTVGTADAGKLAAR